MQLCCVISGTLEPDEFMNCKKSHEVQAMSEVVARLAKRCKLKQVIDVGSGKGYLCSYLSMRYGLQVFGVDSSSTNTHGAQERNRKLKKFSKAYQTHSKAARKHQETSEGANSSQPGLNEEEDDSKCAPQKDINVNGVVGDEVRIPLKEPVGTRDGSLDQDTADLFFSALSLDVVETVSPRIPPNELSKEEKERRKRENLKRKARSGADSRDSSLFSTLTSYVTAETELGDIIPELEDAVMVGLHTCGDLAPSTLRMFAAKRELQAVCSVGCCYHLLTEVSDPSRREGGNGVCGFPMSRYLKDQNTFCGRNARMSACLALERVTVGGGLPMESLFYRAVLHVILQDHFDAYKSEKRVGNVYAKASTFVDYIRRALRRLDLDESKLSDDVIQAYHDHFQPRMSEMVAFNLLKVTLAPCIEGFILLDRLCFLKEQDNVSYSALVQLFDPLTSPRCYAIVGVKTPRDTTKPTASF
ncbi:methyltransferase-like protein 25 isoform X2 [Denticeps clupeoides]|uniref:methyltransferase-like protein 25 isoform X2 n=1 Tax=Denticeps clupeoides TaxID=299321 RepID=UPI0010A3C580|nr:methyltransferase-like protein 25 isoform X2 [Denticeps clupeoides]